MAPTSCRRRHVLTRTLLGRGGSWCTSSSHAGRLSGCDIDNTIYVTTVTLSSLGTDLVASAHARATFFGVLGSTFEVLGSWFRVLGSCPHRLARCAGWRPAAHQSLRCADRARPDRRRHR